MSLDRQASDDEQAEMETNVDEDSPDETSELMVSNSDEESGSDVDRESTPLPPDSRAASTRDSQSTTLSPQSIDDETETIDRMSPYVPAAEQADAQTAAASDAPRPPSYSAAVLRAGGRARPAEPPAYNQLPAIRGSVPLPRREIELQPIPSGSDPLATSDGPDGPEEGRRTAPPPYDLAVRSNVAETTFSEEETRPTAGRDEPPPNYLSVGNGEGEDAARARDVEAASRSESRTSSVEPGDRILALISRLRSSLALGPAGKRNTIIACVVIALLVLFVAFFPFQFSYVSYYQYGLVRTKSTGRVSTVRVYDHGCYVLGADKEFVHFNRTVKMIEFKQLGMFTADNVDLSIDTSMYYLLQFEGVGKLYKDFAGKHEDVIEAAARTTIRNCGPRVRQDQYIKEREYVGQLIHNALKDKFANWGIEIPFFNYLNLHLPDRVIARKLEALLIRTDIEKELAYQQQREVELRTELITTPIIYEAKEVINNATARAAAINVESKTEKARTVEKAHSGAFQSMMNMLNVTRTDHALSFFYLATLNTMDNFGGAVQFNKLGLYQGST